MSLYQVIRLVLSTWSCSRGVAKEPVDIGGWIGHCQWYVALLILVRLSQINLRAIATITSLPMKVRAAIPADVCHEILWLFFMCI